MQFTTLARVTPGKRGLPLLEGWVHPAFTRVADCLAQQIAGYGGGGAACVYHQDECVVDLWGGVRDRAGNPWLRETMSPSFSTTKGVAATLVHVLADRQLLDYDDLVADHWPTFAQAGKERITIRQVLAHQSGLYHIRQMIDHADRMRDWKHMVSAIERARPIHTPGERTGYHGLTFGFIVGELAQRVTGQRFSELVRREIVEPLALDGMYIGAPAHALERAAQLMTPTLSITKLLEPSEHALGRLGVFLSRASNQISPLTRYLGVDFDFEGILDALAPRGISTFDFGSGQSLRSSIPSGNGLFTARSLARMYAMLAAGGELDGVRVLSGETLRRATEPQKFSGGRSVLPFDMRWRLGYHGVATTRGIPRRAFGHFGFGGSGAWAEPNRRLAVALIVNAGIGTPFGDLRILRIGGAALAASDARSPRKAHSVLRSKRSAPSKARRTPAPVPLRPAARRGQSPARAGRR